MRILIRWTTRSSRPRSRGTAEVKRPVRIGVSLFFSLAGTAGCIQGSGIPMSPHDVAVSAVHPREAAEKIAWYAKEISRIMGPGRNFDRTVVLPLPCGGDGSRQTVPGRNVELNSWWVSYSPYAESIDTFVELDSSHSIQPVLARLRDGLREAGWEIVEYIDQGSPGGAVLKAAAPEAGYGATFEGIAPAAGRSPRIGVNISSPCLRHPEAR
jgi:hypothetical protein